MALILPFPSSGASCLQHDHFMGYFLNIYLFLAAWGLSCGTWDLHGGVWALDHAGPVVIAHVWA